MDKQIDWVVSYCGELNKQQLQTLKYNIEKQKFVGVGAAYGKFYPVVNIGHKDAIINSSGMVDATLITKKKWY